MSKEEFIEKSKKIHGDKYDYSLVEYKNNKTKVKIICHIHGIFEQRPDNHLQGQNCPKCHIRDGYNEKSSTKEFIKKAKKTHKNKYDYSLVEYENNYSKVKIICKEHGIFEQSSSSHLNGNQLPSCTKNRKFTQEEFINYCKITHNDFYDYSLIVYKNMNSKIKIICPIHGEFEQKARRHKEGRGCWLCSKSHGERIVENFLIKNNINYIPQKTFENCKYKYKLLFDFYLPDYNTCIEFDGEQHFIQYRWEDNDDDLKIRIKRDEIKNEYCLENNIHLCRIKFNEDINNKLLEISSAILNIPKMSN